MAHHWPVDRLRKTRVFLGPQRAHDWFGAIHQGHHHHRGIPPALPVDQYDLSIGIPVRRLDRSWRRILQRNEQFADARAANADLRAHWRVRFAVRASLLSPVLRAAVRVGSSTCRIPIPIAVDIRRRLPSPETWDARDWTPACCEAGACTPA